RQSCSHTIWPEENAGSGQNWHCLRFYRRTFCRLRFEFYLRGLDGLRQAAKNLSRRVWRRIGVAGLGRHHERRGQALSTTRDYAPVKSEGDRDLLAIGLARDG